MYKIIAVRKVTFNDDVKFKDLSRSTSPVDVEAIAGPSEVKIVSRGVSGRHSRFSIVIPHDVSDSNVAPEVSSEVLPKAPFVIPDFSKAYAVSYKSCSYAPVFGKKGNYIDDLVTVLTNSNPDKIEKAEKLVKSITDLVSSKVVHKFSRELFLSRITETCRHYGVDV